MMDRQTQSTPRQLRSAREIARMRRAGLVVWEAHQAAARLVRPGVATQEIDRAVADVFGRHNAVPLFLGYPGKVPFPAATCISRNHEIVHGIPGTQELQEGDIVSIDTGCSVDGWCGDAAITHPVGTVSAAAAKLLLVTRGVLDLAIEQIRVQKRWSQVAQQMQAFVERHGFSVVQALVGHGIGRKMHEAPVVPNFYQAHNGPEDFDLRPGTVIAIEPMINVGSKDIRLLGDHWTIVTADGSLSAHFEHTVAITEDGPRRLTAAPEPNELELVSETFRDPNQWVRW
jgi:methionyl aminopeptidase